MENRVIHISTVHNRTAIKQKLKGEEEVRATAMRRRNTQQSGTSPMDDHKGEANLHFLQQNLPLKVNLEPGPESDRKGERPNVDFFLPTSKPGRGRSRGRGGLSKPTRRSNTPAGVTLITRFQHGITKGLSTCTDQSQTDDNVLELLQDAANISLP